MIFLTPRLRAELIRRADAEAPEECCGLISEASRASRGKGTGIALWAAENAAETPESNFFIALDNQVGILRQIEARGETVIGLYHSHAGSPTPSEADFATAMNWPGLTWVIVGRDRCPNCEDGAECCGNVLETGECCAALYGTDRLVPCQTCAGSSTVPDFWIGSLP